MKLFIIQSNYCHCRPAAVPQERTEVAQDGGPSETLSQGGQAKH